MRVLNSLDQSDLKSVPAQARKAEADGYDGVVTYENRHDPFLSLAVAAVHTERIALRTSVAIAFPRSPMVAANIAWDLQAASGGRFELGLGSQVRGHNERRFSVPWSPPAPRMKEYVQAVKAIWRTWSVGEPLAFSGDHYQFSLMTPNFTPPPLDGPPPKIMMAAVGPAMLRVAGEVCDAVQLHGFCTRDYIEQHVIPELTTGLRRAGRTRSDIEISGGGFICTGADEEAVAKSVELVRQRLGFYGSTRAYWPVLEQHGLEELGLQLNHLSKNNGWREMTGLVTDDMVRLFAAVGTYDEIANAVRNRFGGLTDTIGMTIGPGSPADHPPDLIQELKLVA